MKGFRCTYTKLDGDGEVIDACSFGNGITTFDTWQIHKGVFNDTLLTLGGLQKRLCESESGVGHGEGGRTRAILGLDDFIASKLNSVHQSIELVGRNVDGRLGQAEEWHNGVTRMTTDNGDVEFAGVFLSNDASDESLGTDDVKGGDTEQLLGVEDTSLLEDLGSDRDCRIDRVGNDGNGGLGGVLCDGNDEVFDDTGVDLEEVVSGHAGFTCD